MELVPHQINAHVSLDGKTETIQANAQSVKICLDVNTEIVLMEIMSKSGMVAFVNLVGRDICVTSQIVMNMDVSMGFVGWWYDQL